LSLQALLAERELRTAAQTECAAVKAQLAALQHQLSEATEWVEFLEAHVQQTRLEQPLAEGTDKGHAGRTEEDCREQPLPFPSANAPQGCGAPVLQDTGMLPALLH